MRHAIVLAVLAIFGGCSLFSRIDPTDAGSLDGGADLGAPCTESSTCPAAVPVCAMGRCSGCAGAGASSECATYHVPLVLCGPSGACVECVSRDDCATSNRTCREHACAPCQTHAECTSGVCKPDGACAAPSEVAYVNNTSSTGVTCTDAVHASTPMNPYCQVQAAATLAARPYVVVAGSGTPYRAVSLSSAAGAIGPMTIVGPGRGANPSARLEPQVVAPAFAVTTLAGNAATIIVDGLEVIGTGSSSAGVRCTVSSGVATLTVKDSYIHNSGGAGINTNDCTVTMEGNTVSGNQGGGVTTSGGTVTMEGNTVSGNQGGGVHLLATTNYTVTNNIIHSNGLNARGVTIDDTASGTFAFNTVAKNLVSAGVGGIGCGGGGAKMIQHSIVFGNTAPAPGGTQFFGNCTLSNVVTGADTIMGDIEKTPEFVESTTVPFRLKSSSTANLDCCVDKVTNPGTPNANRDVNGAMRPKGAAHDIGAHEAQ